MRPSQRLAEQRLARIEEAETRAIADQLSCTLFTGYKPKPGGQSKFWDTIPFDRLDDNPCRVIWLRGGIGSGKSHVGSAFVCSRAFLDPASRGLITANSYSQLETSTLIALAEFCDQFGIPISPRRSTIEETAKAIAARRLVKIFDASLLVLSAEAFMGETSNSRETGRGLQIRYFWGDEYAYAPKSVFDTLNGRLGRGEGKIKGLGLITSSINRNNPYNYCYELFDAPDRGDEVIRLYKSINCLSADNDSLDPDYVPTLEASYTPEMAALELRGEYAVSATGRAFNHFSRDRHVSPTPFNRQSALHLSFDFNRNPATCAIGQQAGDRLHFIDEIYLPNSDTFALGKEARAKIDALNPFLVYIHGDASGRSLTANSQQSNWDIIGNALSGLPLNWQVPTANPPIADTLNSANALLHHGRITVDPRCKELIKDLEVCRLLTDGKPDKKSDPLRFQIADGFRYLCNDLFPYQAMGSRGAIVGGQLKKVQF